MKKVNGIIFAIVILCILNSGLGCKAYADTSTITYKEISLDSIEGIVKHNNIDVAIAMNNSDKALLDYNKAVENASIMYTNYSTVDISTPEGILRKSNYYDAWQALVNILNLKEEAYYGSLSSYIQIMRNQILSYKQQYIGYESSMLQIDKMNLTIQKSSRILETSRKKLNLKYISQKQFDELQDAYNQQIRSLAATEKQANISLSKMRTNLGLDNNATVSSLGLADFGSITILNYENELKLTLGNNLEIKNAKTSLSKAISASPFVGEDVNIASLNLTKIQTKVTQNFKDSWDKLHSTYEDYILADASLSKKIVKTKAMETKFKYAYISKNQLNDFYNEIKDAQLQQKIDNYSLQSQYLVYQNTRSGY